MKNKLASFICLAFFGVSAMGTSKRKPEDAGLPVATATVEPTATTTATTKPGGKKTPAGDGKPDPAADYKGFEDANLDGKSAFGKTVLTRMRRTSTTESTFTGYACSEKGGTNSALISYSDSQRNTVRAMPQLANYRDTCPRILFKIKGFQPYTKNFHGELVEILDVSPEEAEKPPAGADYGSIDAVLMDGPAKYKGKIAEFEAYRTATKAKQITVTPCNAGFLWIQLSFKADQRDAVKSIGTEYNHCSTVKIKMGAPSPYSRLTMNGELVEVK